MTGGQFSETDENGVTRFMQSDGRGEPAGHDEIRVEVDAEGNERHINTKTGDVTVERYDERRNLIFTQYPDNTREEWVIDDRGLRTAQISRDGTLTKFEHDAHGNLVRTTYSNAARRRSLGA